MSKVARQVGVVVIGVSLGVGAIGQWRARHQLEHRYQDALKVRKGLELELGELRADRNRLSEALTGEQQRVAKLSSTLSAKDAELQEVVDRLSQEERIIQEFQGRLLAMQVQFDRLQGELAHSLEGRPSIAEQPPSPGKGKMVQLEKVVVTNSGSALPGLQGRVISVNPEWRFVVIDLGWNVVNIGDVVSIYRNDQLLGKARVERVQEQVSAASLLPEWMESEIQVNDVVRML